METDERIVTLIDEEGEAFDFVIVDCFTVEEQEYAVMVPLLDEEDDDADDEAWDEDYENGDAAAMDDELADDYDDGDDEVLEEEEAIIFRLYRDDEGETSFQLIEDEEEWQRISSIAFERLSNLEE